MTDYISREAAITAIQKAYIDTQEGFDKAAVKINVGLTKALHIMQDLPAADVVERKKGKWTVGADMPPMRYRNGKPKKFWQSLRYCSVCGHEAFHDSDWGEQLFDWCPYCGADMRGERWLNT